MQRKMAGGQEDMLTGVATAQWRWIVLAACVPHLAWNLVLALLALSRQTLPRWLARG